jgi:cell division protease FtsH
MDTEVKKIVENQYARAKDLLSKNQDKLTQLANQLLEKEVIFKEDLEKIFGKRPFEKEEHLIPEGNEKKSKPMEVAEDGTPSSEAATPAASANGSTQVGTESSEEVSDGDITKKE